MSAEWWSLKITIWQPHSNNNCFIQKLESVDTKLVGENMIKNKIKSPTAHFLIKKGKIVIWLEKPGRHHLNQVIKVIIISNGTNWYHLTRELDVIFCDNSTKMYNLNLIVEKHKRNPNWGTFYKNKWPLLFKNIKIMITTERLF